MAAKSMRAVLSEIARIARTLRDPRSVDHRNSARVAKRRARAAERAKDAVREKAEVEHVSLEGELAGGREESVSLEKRGVSATGRRFLGKGVYGRLSGRSVFQIVEDGWRGAPGVAEMDVCAAGGWRGVCVPQDVGCEKKSRL